MYYYWAALSLLSDLLLPMKERMKQNKWVEDEIKRKERNEDRFEPKKMQTTK